MSEGGLFRLVPESNFRLCVSFGELLSDQWHVVIQNMQTNRGPSQWGHGDDKRNGRSFSGFLFQLTFIENPNNLDYLNLKLDCLKLRNATQVK